MRSPRSAAVSLLLLVAAGPTTRPTNAPSPQSVLALARTIPDGGGYNKTWSGTGVPAEVVHDGQRVLAAGTGGTYCCGFTFAVAMRAAGEAGLLEGKSIDEVRRFQKQWYGATKESAEKQPAFALPALGIGREVPADEAKPGDFLQFWRTNKSGHSVIFLGWVESEDGRRTGVRYRSSQGSTDGIGDTEEKFDGHGGKVDPQRMYFARFGS